MPIISYEKVLADKKVKLSLVLKREQKLKCKVKGGWDYLELKAPKSWRHSRPEKGKEEMGVSDPTLPRSQLSLQ